MYLVDSWTEVRILKRMGSMISSQSAWCPPVTLVMHLYVTVSGKRVHSAQNVPSSYKAIISTEFNFVELLVNIPKGSMIP